MTSYLRGQRPGDSPGFVSPPQVMVPLPVWQRLMTYVQLCPVEINGFGYLDRTGQDFELSEVFILDQEVTGGSAENSALAVAQHLTGMIGRGDDPGRMRFQWHSHVSMAAYFSGTDLENIEAYDSDWMVSLVTNKRGEYSLRLDVFRPFRAWTPLDLQIVLPADPATADACAENIRRKVRRADRLFRTRLKPDAVSDELVLAADALPLGSEE